MQSCLLDKKKEIYINKNINNLKKYIIMKKILFVVVVVMVIMGCLQNEEIEKVVQLVEISFNMVVSKIIRVMILVNLVFIKFMVYVYFIIGVFVDVIKVNVLIFGVEFIKGENFVWGSGNFVFYWLVID